MEIYTARAIASGLLSVLATVSMVVSGWGSTDETDACANGPLQEQPDRMRELIRWTLDGPRLAIRKDWKPISDQQKQKEFDAKIEAMIERGFDEATARRLAEQTLKNRMVDEPFGAAFMQLARGNSGQGRSSSGDYHEYRFRGRDLHAIGVLENGRMRISFVEQNGPRREWSIDDRDDGHLIFRYFGDDFLVQMTQKSDGSIHLIRVQGVKAESYVGKNFAMLRKENPALIEQWLLPMFDHLGFSPPLSHANPVVRQAVIEQLKVSDRFDPDRFDKLLVDLNSENFAARDAATETLRSQRDLYRETIARALEQSDLTLEVRTRLNRILQTDATDNEVDRFIREQDLVNSPEYLVGLLTPSDDELNQLICRQLERITGESFTPSQARQRWLNQPGGSGSVPVER